MSDGDTQRMRELLSTAEELAGMGSWTVDLATEVTLWSEGSYRLFGLDPSSGAATVPFVLELVHPDDRARIAEVYETVFERPDTVPDEGLAGEFRVVRNDGSLRSVRFRGRIEHDNGRPARFVGFSQDITDLRATERELRAHYAVGQALRAWQSFDEGVVGLLRRLGTALEAHTASMWTPVPGSSSLSGPRLSCRALWTAPEIDPRPVEAVVRSAVIQAGDSLPIRAWRAEIPVVEEDFAAVPDQARRSAASTFGVCSGLAFPAIAVPGEAPLATLAFYTLDRRSFSPRLVDTLSTIGGQLGRFLAHRRADLGDVPLSARELEVLSLAADGLSGPEIARKLVLAPTTVKTHFENIYEKLGVGDRAAAVAHSLRTGIIR